jgi:hypothetical protein
VVKNNGSSSFSYGTDISMRGGDVFIVTGIAPPDVVSTMCPRGYDKVTYLR